MKIYFYLYYQLICFFKTQYLPSWADVKAFIVVTGLLLILITTALGYYQNLSGYDIYELATPAPTIIGAIIVVFINRAILCNDRRNERYFQEFQDWGRKRKIAYGIVLICIIVAILIAWTLVLNKTYQMRLDGVWSQSTPQGL